MNILYSFRRCPYAIRARMAIAASGLQVKLREVVLRDKPQTLLDLSAKATVPVLLTSNQMVLDESLDIMFWALKQSDPDNWLNYVDQALIDNNDGTFKHWLDHYKYADRHPEQSQQYYRQQGEKILHNLEQCLGETRYLSSDQISFTDIAIFPFIRQFAFVDLTWFEQSPYPKLRQWLASFLDSELFQITMHKYQTWNNDDKILSFFPHGKSR